MQLWPQRACEEAACLVNAREAATTGGQHNSVVGVSTTRVYVQAILLEYT